MTEQDRIEPESVKKSTRLIVIVVAHVVIVLAFFVSTFLWGNFS